MSHNEKISTQSDWDIDPRLCELYPAGLGHRHEPPQPTPQLGVGLPPHCRIGISTRASSEKLCSVGLVRRHELSWRGHCSQPSSTTSSKRSIARCLQPRHHIGYCQLSHHGYHRCIFSISLISLAGWSTRVFKAVELWCYPDCGTLRMHVSQGNFLITNLWFRRKEEITTQEVSW